MPPIEPSNSEARCICLLLLDTSDSMKDKPIRALNEGLTLLETQLKENLLTRARVEVGILTFGSGGVNMAKNFTSVADFIAPVLTTGGGTPMAQAIETGLDTLRQRKDQYAKGGIPCYTPWVFLMTDGQPTDMENWPSALRRVKEATSEDVSRKRKADFVFFAIGVGENADMQLLSALTPRCLHIDQVDFRELFLWISESLDRIAESRPGDQVTTPPVGFGSPVTS